MSLTYTWKLTSLKKRNVGSLNGMIFQTYWTKTGTDENGLSGSFAGATPFDPTQVDPNDFTPWEQLTEEMVLGWIKEVVVGDYEAHVNAEIQRQINDKLHQSQDIVSGSFPWDPPAPTPAPTPAP